MAYIGNTQNNQNYVPAIDYFNGDGSTVAFTLSRPVASVAAVQAVISNVPQNPGSAFTVSGSTITFTSAPPSGTNNIYVYYTSPNTQIVQPGQGTVYPSSLSTGGPYWDTSGNVGIGTSSPAAKLDVSQGMKISPATSSLYSTDSTLSSYGTTNGVYLNGHASGWLALRGDGNGNNGAAITLYGTTEASSAKSITFNTNASERMRIDSSGRVTTPYQPMFTAYRSGSSGNVSSAQLIPLDGASPNVGSAYNTSSFRFTAPVAGTYMFTITGMLATTGFSQADMRFRQNGSVTYYTHIINAHPASGCLSLIVTAAANDYFEYYGNGLYMQNSSGGGYITTFSGFLIG